LAGAIVLPVLDRLPRPLVTIAAGLLALAGIATTVTVIVVTARAAAARDSAGEPTELALPDLTVTAPQATPTAAPAEPDWPDGKIVFTCFVDYVDQVCTMNTDGSAYTQLTDEPATSWYASVSPDGEQIVFSSRRGGMFDIYVMDADGSNVRQLTQGMDGNYAPELSPDGTRIVFASTVNGNTDIYVINDDGTGPVQLTSDASHELDPIWSPDGTMIAYASNRTGSNELYVMNADGSNVRQVTSGSNMLEGGRSSWSPDGRWLAFYAGVRGDKDIYKVEVACAAAPPGCGPDRIVQLTDGGNNKAPSFSPDGEWIAFASNLRGENEIFIMRADGSDWRQLTYNGYADWQPRWGR
jgi:TolB protein